MAEELDVSALPRVLFSAGDTITRPGDGDRPIHVLVDGAVEVRLGEHRLLTIRDRTTFIGELSVLGGAEPSAEVRAVTDCTCHRIDDVRARFDTQPDIYERLAVDIAHKTKASMMRMFAFKEHMVTAAAELGLDPARVPQMIQFLRRWAEISKRAISDWPSTLEVSRDSDPVRTYAAGETLFAAGTRPQELYVLHRGRVAVEHAEPGEPLPDHSTPGSVINLAECIPGTPSVTTARAVEDSEVRIITDLPGRFREDPEFGASVARTFAQRLQALDEAARGYDTSLREVASTAEGEARDKLEQLADRLRQFEYEMTADTGI